MGEGKRTNIIENLEFVNQGERLLKLFTSLEAVLNFNNEEKITETIAERAAMIITDDYNIRIKIKKRIKDIYDDRSKMVHQGVTYASKCDLDCLTDYIREVLYKLIELKKERSFNNKEQLRAYIEEIKLS